MTLALRRRLLAPLAVLVLAGCATSPEFDLRDVHSDLPPTQAAENMAAHQGKRVVWGGIIVTTANLKDATQIEVLAYPLDSDFWPRQSDPPLGRFLALHPGYLEPVDFAAGRVVSVVGTLAGTREGIIGEMRYTYPLLDVSQIHLWPKEGKSGATSSNVHFGIGVVFH